MSDAAPAAQTGKELVYYADPMCSWCYGFSPVIGAIAGHFGARLPVRLVMGGLRAGNTRPMRAEDRDYIRNAWTRVGAASGQPFDFAFFDRPEFTYDTEPACRAVVAVRRRAPDRALAFMARLSSAFYGANRDITDAEVIADIAAEAGLDRAELAQDFMSPDVRNETFRDFLAAQELGVQGFPTLIAGPTARGYALVTNGYRPLDGLIEALERWLAEAAEA